MIVDALLSVIVISIIYYFSVVIIEISILLTAARKAKLNKLKGMMSPVFSAGKSPKKLTGDEALRNANILHEDDLTAGGMDTQQNPLLLRAGSLNLGTKEKSKPGLTQEARQLAEGFCELEGRLPSHLWPAFQATFAEVATASNQLSEAISLAKKRIQDSKLGVSLSKSESKTGDAEMAGEEEKEKVEGEQPSAAPVDLPNTPNNLQDKKEGEKE